MPLARHRLFHGILAAAMIAVLAPITTARAAVAPGEPHPTYATFHQHVGPPAGHESATDVVVQPDGKVVVALLNDAEVDQRIVRLLPDGQLDTTFAAGGVWHKPSVGNVTVRSLALQPDGKIVYAGESASLPGIVIGRLTSTGEPDLTFSGNGDFVAQTATGSAPLVEEVLVDASGTISFAGVIKNGTKADDLFLGRLTSVGVDDPAFAGSPIFMFGSPADADADSFGGMARMPNGDYIIGNKHMATASQVWRISSTGGSRIAANVAFPTGYNDPIDVVATDATHAVVLLQGSHTSGLAYLDVAGTPKISTHAGNAGSIQPFPSSFRGHQLLRQPDGRLLVSGTDSTTELHRAIARVHPVGTPDASWGTSGIRHLTGTSTSRFYLDRHALTIAPDGSVVSAYHAVAGEVRRPIVETRLAQFADIRPEIVTPLVKGTVDVPVDYTLRVVNDGPDASGAGSLTFQTAEGLRVMSWNGLDCTLDARGGTCRYPSIAAGANRSVTIRMKATAAGTHGVTMSADAATHDTVTANDSTSADHLFEVAPPAPPAAGDTTTPPPGGKPGVAPGTTKPKPLALTLVRIAKFDGRVIRGCGTFRVMCVVRRDRAGVTYVPAYLRTTTSDKKARTLILAMQVKVGKRWVTKFRHRVPVSTSGRLDMKLPSDWRSNTSTWRTRMETVTRRGQQPTVSTWMWFKVA